MTVLQTTAPSTVADRDGAIAQVNQNTPIISRADAGGNGAPFPVGQLQQVRSAGGNGGQFPVGGIPKLWTAGELGQASFPPLRWLIPGLLPSGLTVLAGKSKVGKSWLALSCALAVAHGKIALGAIELTEPAGVLLLALEDCEETLQERLRELEDVLPDNLHCSFEWPRGEAGVTALITTLDAHSDIRLVIIDVWAKFRSPRHGRGKADPYTEAYDELSPLQRLAANRNIAIVILTHAGKYIPPGGDWMDQVLGSVGIAGAADTIALLTRKRGEQRAQFMVGGRRLRDNIELDLDRGDRSGWQIVGDATEVFLSEERYRLLAVVREEPPVTTMTEIYDALQAVSQSEKSAVRKLVFKCAEAGLLTRIGTGKYLKHKNSSNTGNSRSTGNSGNNSSRFTICG